MITKLKGTLRSVAEESCILGVEPFMEVEVLIPEYARRQLQAKVDEPVVLHTVFDIEGNQMSGRMKPRLIGFLSPVDREFFEVFCSVDGVGVRKALRAMVRPVRELARMVQDSDVKTLSTFPGIGEATAERIVAKLRRKVSKFALMVGPSRDDPSAVGAEQRNGQEENAEPDVIRDTYHALLSVGHSDAQARLLIDQVLSGKKKYKTVDAMLMAIYQNETPKT